MDPGLHLLCAAVRLKLHTPASSGVLSTNGTRAREGWGWGGGEAGVNGTLFCTEDN